MKTNDKDRLIRQIQATGESLIKNASDLVGDPEYLYKLTFEIEVDVHGEYLPIIKTIKETIPERSVTISKADGWF